MKTTSFFLNKVSIISVSFSFLLGTLFLSSNIFVDRYSAPKWYVFWGGAFVLSIFMLIRNTSKHYALYLSRLDIILFVFYSYIVIHLIWVGLKIEYIFSILSILIFYCFFKQKWVNNTRRFFFSLIAICCFIQSFWGIILYIVNFKFTNEYHLTGSFENPAGFAASTCVGIPFCFYLFQDKDRRVKCFAYVSCICITIGILLSESRTAIFSVFIIFMLYFITRYKKKINIYIKIGCFAFIILLLIGLYNMKSDSANGRLFIWQCTWNMIKSKPIIGKGLGTFNSEYMQSQAYFFQENPNNKYSILADNVKHPFNEYLMLLYQEGLVGLIFVFLIISVIIKNRQRISKDKEANTAILALGLVAIFSFFSYPFQYSFIWMVTIFSFSVISSKLSNAYIGKFRLNIKARIVSGFIVSTRGAFRMKRRSCSLSIK